MANFASHDILVKIVKNFILPLRLFGQPDKNVGQCDKHNIVVLICFASSFFQTAVHLYHWFFIAALKLPLKLFLIIHNRCERWWKMRVTFINRLCQSRTLSINSVKLTQRILNLSFNLFDEYISLFALLKFFTIWRSEREHSFMMGGGLDLFFQFFLHNYIQLHHIVRGCHSVHQADWFYFLHAFKWLIDLPKKLYFIVFMEEVVSYLFLSTMGFAN